MSAKVEAGGEGSPQGLSEAIQDGQSGAIVQLMMHIVRTAISSQNVLTPEAQVQIDLRDEKSRGKVLEQLILEVCPNGVNPDLWLRWLRGGAHAFSPKLKKVGPGDERPAQTLVRTLPRVRTQEKKIDRLRAELEEEERQLAYLKAHQNAAVYWHVVDQLIGIMAPAIAMGPAWTVMRSLSGYMPDEEADFRTRVLYGKQKEEAIVKIREQKQAESEALMEALDIWSGNASFEVNLRDAIQKVVREFEPRRQEWVQKGRRRRSKRDMIETPHPDARVNSEEILAGLPRRQ